MMREYITRASFEEYFVKFKRDMERTDCPISLDVKSPYDDRVPRV